ncbi:MAG: NAD(P)H-hydrate dehydratase [Phycisphaerales bacterium]
MSTGEPVHHFTAKPVTLPLRPTHGHKGTFGTVLVIGGCTLVPPEAPHRAVRMFGGASLAALAALRSGCGLARLMTPAPVLDAALSVAPVCTGVPMPVDSDGGVIAHRVAEALDVQLAQVQCIVIGPALGGGEPAAGTAGHALEQIVLRVLMQTQVPVVADADAVNALARIPDAARDVRAAAVVTPHPGEFARLAASLGVAFDASRDEAREPAARAVAQRLGVTVVLKGARTIVTDGHHAWTLDRPNPALATGGSGDVLAGLIGGLIAQHHLGPDADSLTDMAKAGVWAHAEAGARWANESGATGGLLATDLLDRIPACVEALRR